MDTLSFGTVFTWTLVFSFWKEFNPTWNQSSSSFNHCGVLLGFESFTWKPVFECAFDHPIMLFLSCLVENSMDRDSVIWYLMRMYNSGLCPFKVYFQLTNDEKQTVIKTINLSFWYHESVHNSVIARVRNSRTRAQSKPLQLSLSLVFVTILSVHDSGVTARWELTVISQGLTCLFGLDYYTTDCTCCHCTQSKWKA